jgi:hypothetical protein
MRSHAEQPLEAQASLQAKTKYLKDRESLRMELEALPGDFRGRDGLTWLGVLPSSAPHPTSAAPAQAGGDVNAAWQARLIDALRQAFPFVSVHPLWVDGTKEIASLLHLTVQPIVVRASHNLAFTRYEELQRLEAVVDAASTGVLFQHWHGAHGDTLTPLLKGQSDRNPLRLLWANYKPLGWTQAMEQRSRIDLEATLTQAMDESAQAPLTPRRPRL